MYKIDQSRIFDRSYEDILGLERGSVVQWKKCYIGFGPGPIICKLALGKPFLLYKPQFSCW